MKILKWDVKIMGKQSNSSTILACVAVGLAAIVAIAAITINGWGKKDPVTESSSVDTVSLPSSSSEEAPSSVPSSTEETPSSSKTNSSSEANQSLPKVDSSLNQGSSSTTSSGDKVCYLTFDDGPCANTDEILNILKENDVKATFFVVGTMSTGKIKSIYEAGHAIGLHTNTHELDRYKSKYVYKNVDSFINDLKGISDVVYQKTGVRSNLTRFPGGSATAKARLGTTAFVEVKAILKENGYKYFDWTIDSGDTHSTSPSKAYVMNEIRKGLKKNGELRKEVCILMHDIKNVTVEALPDIIKELKELGYTFKALDSRCNSFAHY